MGFNMGDKAWASLGIQGRPDSVDLARNLLASEMATKTGSEVSEPPRGFGNLVMALIYGWHPCVHFRISWASGHSLGLSARHRRFRETPGHPKLHPTRRSQHDKNWRIATNTVPPEFGEHRSQQEDKKRDPIHEAKQGHTNNTP